MLRLPETCIGSPDRTQPSSTGNETMTERMFRLMERHQKLDALIARARNRRFVDPAEIEQLRKRKIHLRDRLARLLTPALAPSGL